MKRIDSHHHFWDLKRGDLGWITPDMAPIRRDFLPADFAPIRKKHDIVASIVVQAAPAEAETDHLLTLASDDSSIGGVVGLVDLTDRASVKSLERFAKNPVFKGVRAVLQEAADEDWLRTRTDPHVIRALVDLGLRLDVLARPQHLLSLAQFALAHKDLPIVIDHCGKPQIASAWQGAWPGQWLRALMAIGQMPHVHVKLSGLLTEMSAEQRQRPNDFLAPVCEFIGEVFGPFRIMWGSDWPMLDVAASYDEWIAICDSFIEPLEAEHKQAIWHDNAARFYAIAR